MKLSDIIKLGIKGISERKVRTALTVLTVVIGIAAIVSLVSLVSGITASITSSLQSIGPTSLFVIPSRSGLLTAADVAEIEAFPNVSDVIPAIEISANVTINGQQTTATIVGINNYSVADAIGSINLYSGTMYNQTTLPLAVVGHDLAFPTSSQTSPSVNLNQPLYLTLRTPSGLKSVSVVSIGILDAYGSSTLSPDSAIFMPLGAVEGITNQYSFSALIVKASNAAAVTPLYNLLTEVYGSTASVLSVQQIAATVASITGSLALLLGSIAGVSLIVAGISILSIMMVSVTERTKEIGILKAIGFKKRDILVLFLTEAVIIGFLGGVIGILVGGGGAYALPALLSGASHAGAPGAGAVGRSGAVAVQSSRGAEAGSAAFSSGAGSSAFGSSSSSISLTPIITPTTIILAIIIALVVSILASLYPAFKAASVDPIVALRSE
jgi:ABC-type antimicrobial peptide transport system permease subunit